MDNDNKISDELEDNKFYDNLFSQLIEEVSENKNNKNEENINIDGITEKNKSVLIEDVCLVNNLYNDEQFNRIRDRQPNEIKISEINIFGKLVNNDISKKEKNDKDNINDKNENVNKAQNEKKNNIIYKNNKNQNKLKKYDMSKINEQIIQKFGKKQ